MHFHGCVSDPIQHFRPYVICHPIILSHDVVKNPLKSSRVFLSSHRYPLLVQNMWDAVSKHIYISVCLGLQQCSNRKFEQTVLATGHKQKAAESRNLCDHEITFEDATCCWKWKVWTFLLWIVEICAEVIHETILIPAILLGYKIWMRPKTWI